MVIIILKDAGHNRQNRRIYSHPVLLTYSILLSVATVCDSSTSKGHSRIFYNESMPNFKPLFVINFDIGAVFCQHSEDFNGMHMHELSILCDKKMDCYQSKHTNTAYTINYCHMNKKSFAGPAMNDENFSFCR
jgi:hypothetical protein